MLWDLYLMLCYVVTDSLKWPSFYAYLLQSYAMLCYEITSNALRFLMISNDMRFLCNAVEFLCHAILNWNEPLNDAVCYAIMNTSQIICYKIPMLYNVIPMLWYEI